MGALLSRYNKTDPSDWEKILSDLDSKIQKAELRLSEIKVRERRVVIVWLVYSLLAYSLYCIGFFSYLNRASDAWDSWVLKLLPVLLGPAIVMGVKKTISMWYRRKQTSEESRLGHLRAKQKLKVEELKKRTAYYATKNLLDRYDSSQRKTGQPPQISTPSGKKPNHLGAGHPQTPGKPVQPIQPNLTTLRQRTPAPNAAPLAGNATPGNLKGSMMTQQPATPLVRAPSPTNENPNQRPNTLQSTGQRNWYDRLVDVIVGDEGPETKYALICENCFSHNGLVLPQEVDDIQYFCPNCKHFNPSRRKRRMGTTSVPLPHADLAVPSRPVTPMSEHSPIGSRSTSPIGGAQPASMAASLGNPNASINFVSPSQPIQRGRSLTPRRLPAMRDGGTGRNGSQSLRRRFSAAYSTGEEMADDESGEIGEVASGEEDKRGLEAERDLDESMEAEGINAEEEAQLEDENETSGKKVRRSERIQKSKGKKGKKQREREEGALGDEDKSQEE
ncbi:uncharacterized protein VTP21DRAFT_601 [Calcarisporiella thermophila]|uniref:uncharacterized protein n=1 Tax=Calcarisporiella thermophila TaxID=911321 RepID=UPI0037431FDF